MCFSTTKNAKAKIAEKDIECYKILIRGIYAPCQKKRYKKNESNPNVPLVKRRDGNYYMIDKGYHSYKTLGSAKASWLLGKIVRFIIPKGTRYYSNRIEYVSETIVMQ